MGNEKSQEQTVDLEKLKKKYFDDYTDNWQKFIRSINVTEFKTKEEASNSMTTFASENSPMKIILEEISKQTNLSAEKPVNFWSLEYFYSFFNSKTAGEKTLTSVDKAFNPLFDFTASKGEKEQGQVSQYGNEMKRVSEILAGKDFDQKAAADDVANANPKSKFYSALDNAETRVNNRAEGFNSTPAGQDIAALLKRPLANLRTWLGGRIQELIAKSWAEQVFPDAKKAEKGYPFDNDNEADLKELTNYLAPGTGTLSKFFDERLKNYFEEVGGQWKVKENSGVKFDDNFVKYLNNAFRLREALFGKNSTPKFEYEFKLQKMNDALIDVTIDGQKTDSNGTGSAKFTFPSSGGDTGVVMNFASTSETTSTAAAPPTPTPATSDGNSSSSPPPASKPKPSSSSPSNDSGKRSYQGVWGLFKFFEAGAPGAKNANGEYTLTYKLGGKTVTATIKPPTNADLFERSIFSSSKAPEKMLK